MMLFWSKFRQWMTKTRARPNMPVQISIHEALRLYNWAVQDRTALEAAGMDWQLVEDLAVRAAALRHAQSLWASERFQSEEAQLQWAKQSPEAYDLRDYSLVHTFCFAFRRNADLLRIVDMIAEGSTHVDMPQDLKDLAVAGRRSSELLAAINFDMTLLERCESQAEELGRLYAETRNERLAYREAKLIRYKSVRCSNSPSMRSAHTVNLSSGAMSNAV